MHYNQNVSPLLVSGIGMPLVFVLWPVPLALPLPSAVPHHTGFLCEQGQRITLHEGDALRVRKYMQRYDTEALTSAGAAAFTLVGNDLVECNPAAHGQPAERLLVAFQPQEWIQGAERDVGSAEHVDATARVLALDAEQIRLLRDRSAPAAALVDAEACGHLGPHAVICEAALCAFFGVSDVGEVTQEAVNGKLAAFLVQAGSSRERTSSIAEAVWAIPLGQDGAHYFCAASSRAEAIAECCMAFPDARVGSAALVI